MFTNSSASVAKLLDVRGGVPVIAYGYVVNRVSSEVLEGRFKIPSNVGLFTVDVHGIQFSESVPGVLGVSKSFNNFYYVNGQILVTLWLNENLESLLGSYVRVFGGYNKITGTDFPAKIYAQDFSYLLLTRIVKEGHSWKLLGCSRSTDLKLDLDVESMPHTSTAVYAPLLLPGYFEDFVVDSASPFVTTTPKIIQSTSASSLSVPKTFQPTFVFRKESLDTKVGLDELSSKSLDLRVRFKQFCFTVEESENDLAAYAQFESNLENIWSSFMKFALDNPKFEWAYKYIAEQVSKDALNSYDKTSSALYYLSRLSSGQIRLALLLLSGASLTHGNLLGALSAPYLWGIANNYGLSVCDFLYLIASHRGTFKPSSEGRGVLAVLHNYDKIAQSTVVSFKECCVNPKLPYKALNYLYDVVTSWLGLSDSTLQARTSFNKNVVEFAEQNGIIYMVGRDDMFITSQYLERELYIYNTFINLAKNFTGISEGSLTEIVNTFQSNKGFILEPQQVQGISLSRRFCGVLSGCAGSGKTTVCKLIASALERSGYTPIFAAPTGKAARRLAESVESHVSTLHSLFRLNPDNLNSDFEESIQDFEDIVNPAFIFDEMAMCSTDLLYQVVRKLPTGAPVYLIGDSHQLPPIGKGIPFKRLFNIVPSVELGVSQRSASDSTINKNSSLLISSLNSLGVGPDFNTISCPDDAIIRNIQETCKSYLAKGYSPDDIQVLTPYSKQSLEHKWSVSTLNPIIQKILNPNPPLFVHRSREFRYGDRVIHTSNDHTRPRYRMTSFGTLEEAPTRGVVNGEVGKVAGLAYYKKDLQNAIYESSFYLLVSYYDVELEEDTIVLYQMDSKDPNAAYLTRGIFDEEDPEVLVNFYSKDLNDLMLAYAITVHKSQGSQYPVVIFPMGSKDSPNFVNRNMIYTAISRAQQHVTLVGSVKGAGSAMERGRRVVKSGSDVHDVYEYFLS